MTFLLKKDTEVMTNQKDRKKDTTPCQFKEKLDTELRIQEALKKLMLISKNASQYLQVSKSYVVSTQRIYASLQSLQAESKSKNSQQISAPSTPSVSFIHSQKLRKDIVLKNTKKDDAEEEEAESGLEEEEEEFGDGYDDDFFEGSIKNRHTADIYLSEVRIPLMWSEEDHFKRRKNFLGAHKNCVFLLARIGNTFVDSRMLCDVDAESTDLTFNDVFHFEDVDPDFTLTLQLFSRSTDLSDTKFRNRQFSFFQGTLKRSSLNYKKFYKHGESAVHSNFNPSKSKATASLPGELSEKSSASSFNQVCFAKFHLLATASLSIKNLHSSLQVHDLKLQAHSSIHNISSSPRVGFLPSRFLERARHGSSKREGHFGNSGLDLSLSQQVHLLPILSHFSCKLSAHPSYARNAPLLLPGTCICVKTLSADDSSRETSFDRSQNQKCSLISQSLTFSSFGRDHQSKQSLTTLKVQSNTKVGKTSANCVKMMNSECPVEESDHNIDSDDGGKRASPVSVVIELDSASTASRWFRLICQHILLQKIWGKHVILSSKSLIKEIKGTNQKHAEALVSSRKLYDLIDDISEQKESRELSLKTFCGGARSGTFILQPPSSRPSTAPPTTNLSSYRNTRSLFSFKPASVASIFTHKTHDNNKPHFTYKSTAGAPSFSKNSSHSSSSYSSSSLSSSSIGCYKPKNMATDSVPDESKGASVTKDDEEAAAYIYPNINNQHIYDTLNLVYVDE